MQAHEKHLNHRDITKTWHGLGYKAQFTITYHTTRSLDPTWYNVCALRVDHLDIIFELHLGQPTSLPQAPSWFLESHNELFISLHCFKTISPKTLPWPYQVPLWISSWSPLALLKNPSQSLDRHNEFFTLVACFKTWSTETQHVSSPWSCLEIITWILLFDYSLKPLILKSPPS